MRKCKFCNCEIQESDKFCHNCGEDQKYSNHLKIIEKREKLDKNAIKQFNLSHFNSLKQILEKELEYLPTNIEYNINQDKPLEIKVLELLEQSYEMMEVYEKLIRIDYPILENQLYDLLQFRFQEDALIKLILLLDKNKLLHRVTVCGLTFIEWINKDLTWGNLIKFPYIQTFNLKERKLYLIYHNYKLEYGYNPYIISKENIENLEKIKENRRLMKIRDKTEFNTASQELTHFLTVINKTENQLKDYDKNDIYYRIVSLTLISLYNRAFMLTSSNKNRGIIHKEQAKHYENIGNNEKAYENYKYALYFHKRSGAKKDYEKLRKTYGSKDKIENTNYNYKLLKNIKLLEHTGKELKKRKRYEIKYEENGQIVSKKELIQKYYENKGYSVIDTEFLYYYTYLLFLDLQYDIEISVNTTYHKEEVVTRLKQLERLNLKQEIKKAFEKIHTENPEDIETDKEIEKILMKILEILGSDKLLKIVGRNRLNQIYDCKYLPCKGIPSLLVYNSNDFFFSEVLTSEEKPNSRQMYWHYYISEKVDIPIEISLINKEKEEIEKIYCSK